MNARLGTALLIAACLAWCANPASASAADILLGYGAAYPSGTHRGIDVAAAEGESVTALASGTVLFAGTVPADGGGTCIAVTILTDEGLRLSVLPLADVQVAEGANVAIGDELGPLAARGDDSSTAPHLHVSLRRGDTYLDPIGLVSGRPAEQPAVSAPIAPLPATPDDTPSGGTGVSAPSARPVPAQTAQPAAAPQPSSAAAAAATLIRHAAPRHVQIPVEAGVPEASELRSHVELARRTPSLAIGTHTPLSTPIAAAVTGLIACVGFGARRFAAARAC